MDTNFSNYDKADLIYIIKVLSNLIVVIINEKFHSNLKNEKSLVVSQAFVYTRCLPYIVTLNPWLLVFIILLGVYKFPKICYGIVN